MKIRRFNKKSIALLFAIAVFFCSVQSLSFGQVTLTVSDPASLTEATLHNSTVTLTLQGGEFDDNIERTWSRPLNVSGISGVEVGDVKRLSNTEIRVRLEFSGNFDRDDTLTFRVRSWGIKNYNGSDLTDEIPVTATTESLTATPASLTEATLHDSTVTLTLQGRTFENNIGQYNLSVSGVSGVSLASNSLKRVSDTQITVRLEFKGNFDHDRTLTFTVGSGNIKNYNGSHLTAALRVTATVESLIVTALSPLTEATLHNSTVTLTLQGRTFEDNVRRYVSVSGISGISLQHNNIQRISDTQITVPLQFSGTLDRDGTLTFRVNQTGIKNYNGSTLTAALRVTATVESLTATALSPLTEATLHNSTVTLTLQGRTFENNIRSYISVSGMSGVSISSVRLLNNTEVEVTLQFSGNFDSDGTLTFTVRSGGIKNYNGSDLTAALRVTATTEPPATTPGVVTTEPPDLVVSEPGVVTTQPPDLVVSDIRASETALIPGEQFTLFTTVGNHGAGQSPIATLSYYMATDNVDWSDVTKISTASVSPLTANGSDEVEHFLTAPTQAGTYYYYACIDAISNEKNSNNNCSGAVQITVAPPATTLEVVTTHLHPSIYWVSWSAGKIQRLEGSNVTDFLTGLDEPEGIAVDVSGGKIYWASSEWNATTNAWVGGKIQCADLDGGNMLTLVTELDRPRGIALDVTGGKIYWTSLGEVNRATNTFTSKIQCADLDGSNVQDLVTGLEPPRGGIASDVAGGKIYWTDWSKIQRADLDGSNVSTLVPGLYNLTGIALDVAGGKMYWTDLDSESGMGIIQSADLDGSNVRDLVTGLDDTRGGIALDVARGKIYWTSEKYNTQTDSFTGKIQSANLDGSNVTDFLTGLDFPSLIALGIPLQTAEEFPAEAETGETSAIVNRPEDVNQDGKVDNVDLGMVAAALISGNPPSPLGRLDVNGDGELTIDDLTQIINNLDADAAAAPALSPLRNALAREKIQAAIDLLLASNDGSIGVQRTLAYLQNLLAAARPDETRLLANYPNPFNPETWIPYQLSRGSDVRITLYDTRGRVVRRLVLGYQSAGYYTSRSRAAYWDGKNDVGESVASGLYFYTFTTGNFTATRKMLIRK